MDTNEPTAPIVDDECLLSHERAHAGHSSDEDHALNDCPLLTWTEDGRMTFSVPATARLHPDTRCVCGHPAHRHDFDDVEQSSACENCRCRRFREEEEDA